MVTNDDTIHDEERDRSVREDPISRLEDFADLSQGLPEKVGPFRILRRLGEGGMGAVYLAEQSEPVRRQVALKIERSRFLDRDGRVRFEAERRVMARLQHPYVAQIFHASATEEGHPYFVMEHVAGDEITTYCDRRKLSINERLNLFILVCSGVQHAHQKGIIHRDLKPSNILVTEVEGRPVPKIIDFGIAKVVDQPRAEETLETGNRLIGTPAYLSPEAAQFGQDKADLDTRSDVYSLGVLLCELLVGQRPFDDSTTNVFQVLQRIASEQAAGPSTLWTGLEIGVQEEVATNRGVDGRALRTMLRGDLDWIVSKAIAHSRDDRYPSASALAADLQRHLRHEPVAAGPPSSIYRLRKFVRRQLGPVIAVTLVVFAMAAGLVARTFEAQRANREASAAHAARLETQQALERVERARLETEELSKFLVDLFEVSDPGEARGSTVTARELLDGAAGKIRTRLPDQPLARARFMQTIAEVYRKLGLFESAERLFDEALEIRQNHLPADHLDVAESLNGLASLRAQLGQFEAAVSLFEESLRIRETILGDSYLVAMSLNNLANSYSELGDPDRAEPLFKRSVEIVRHLDSPPSPNLLVALNNLATLYSDQGRYEEAEPLLRSFLSYQRTAHGLDHPYVAFALENLAEVRWHRGAHEEAENLYLEARSILEEVLGPDHPEVAYCLSSLASLYLDLDRRDESEALFRSALAIQEAKLPADHPERLATVEGLKSLHAVD